MFRETTVLSEVGDGVDEGVGGVGRFREPRVEGVRERVEEGGVRERAARSPSGRRRRGRKEGSADDGIRGRKAASRIPQQ